ncbi:MAG TPA: MMPL family transporter [Stellaceae bacterium]|nr:MMPL family transporter [Stellaceae bacterium]
MIAFIVKLVEVSRRNAAAVVAAVVLLAIAGGYYTAGHISIDTDVDKLINPDLPWRQQQRALDAAFPQRADQLVVVIDAATPDQGADASAALAQRLASEHDLFRTVVRPDSGPLFEKDGLLFLSQKEVQDTSDQLIAAQPLIGTLAADPSLRGVFGALDLAAQGVIHGQIQPSSLATPLDTVAAATTAALQGKLRPISWQTMMTGRKPEALELRRFILTQPRLDYNAVQPGAVATAAIHEAARQLGLTPQNGVTVRVTGDVALSDAQFENLTHGAGFSTALSVGLLCLWLMLALRSLRLFLAIIVTLILGLVACATFAVGVVGPLNPISAAFAVLFVGIAVDFGIQFSVRYRDERFRADNFPEALRATAAQIGGPLGVAAAASAAGFFSFVPTDYSGVSDLGKIAGVGMLVALVLNLSVLPAMLTILRPKGERRPVGIAAAAPVDRFLVHRRRPIMMISLALAVACFALLPLLRFDFNPLHLLNSKQEAVATLFSLMSDPMTTPYTIEYLAPSAADAAALAEKLDKLPEVAQVLTVDSFVPGDQQAKLAIISDTAQLLGPTLTPAQVKPPPTDQETLAAIAACDEHLKEVAAKGSAPAAALAKALDGVLARGAPALPALRANLVAGVERRLDQLRLSLQAGPVTLASLPASLKGDWIAADGRARVEVYPKGDARNNDVLHRFTAAVQRIIPDATGTPVTIQESAYTVTHAFVVAGIIALAAISVLLTLVLRRPWEVLLVLMPLLLAMLLTMATSVLAGLPLNYANIIALPLLLGVGVAFDIYFVMRWRAGSSDLLESSTARAILFSALTTGTAFGSLALSNDPGISEMGKLLTLALFYTLLCTFFVLPALLGPVKER